MIIALAGVYGLFAVVFQSAVVGGRNLPVMWIHGAAAVCQGLSFFCLSAGLVCFMALSGNQGRRTANRIGLFAFVLFFGLQTISWSIERQQAQQAREEERTRCSSVGAVFAVNVLTRMA